MLTLPNGEPITVETWVNRVVEGMTEAISEAATTWETHGIPAPPPADLAGLLSGATTALWGLKPR